MRGTIVVVGLLEVDGRSHGGRGLDRGGRGGQDGSLVGRGRTDGLLNGKDGLGRGDGADGGPVEVEVVMVGAGGVVVVVRDVLGAPVEVGGRLLGQEATRHIILGIAQQRRL